MANPKPQFIIDDHGEKTAAILDMADYRKLLEAAEELEAIRAYDAAKALDNEAIPFDQTIVEGERDRK